MVVVVWLYLVSICHGILHISLEVSYAALISLEKLVARFFFISWGGVGGCVDVVGDVTVAVVLEVCCVWLSVFVWDLDCWVEAVGFLRARKLESL